MRISGTATFRSMLPIGRDTAALTHPRLLGDDQHFVYLGNGLGLSCLATTAELEAWVEQLSAVVGECRVADLRAAMTPLPEVTE